MENSEKIASAIRVARMYYDHDMTTERIARELNVSRSTVSRLLTYAKQEGFVDIHIIDPQEQPRQLEKRILDAFKIQRIHVVPVSEIVSESERLERVAHYTAAYLNTRFSSNTLLGIAWGTTTSAISRHLVPKATHHGQIVQLNGAGNEHTMGIEYASEIMMRFAQNYQASYHLFPVPAFFDHIETKMALWEESSIKRLLALQQSADLLLYSIGAVNAGIPSQVYIGGYLNPHDVAAMQHAHVAGDIATVFFREDGSFNNIAINRRSSGPDPTLFQKKPGICVISGQAKVKGVFAALKGNLIQELIIDEPSARKLVEDYLSVLQY